MKEDGQGTEVMESMNCKSKTEEQMDERKRNIKKNVK